MFACDNRIRIAFTRSPLYRFEIAAANSWKSLKSSRRRTAQFDARNGMLRPESANSPLPEAFGRLTVLMQVSRKRTACSREIQ